MQYLYSRNKYIILFIILAIAMGCHKASPIKKFHCPTNQIEWDSLRHTINTNDSNLVYAHEYIDCIEQSLGYLHDTIYSSTSRDWLATHPEPGQSFIQYLNAQPIRIDSIRKYLYLQKIGKFNKAEARIIEDAATYLSIFFNIPVKILERHPESEIPATAQRKNPTKGHKQLNSIHLLNHVLIKNIPADASVYLGFTATDLYPSAKWNYVFGQASLRNRVGIWSIYRFGQPSIDQETYNKCLLRALKTATHETGHMYSIKHCIAYNCNMSGSNHLAELDRRPPWYCPQCLAKLSWNLNINELQRMKKLQAFWKVRGFNKITQYYTNALESLQ